MNNTKGRQGLCEREGVRLYEPILFQERRLTEDLSDFPQEHFSLLTTAPEFESSLSEVQGPKHSIELYDDLHNFSFNK